MFLPPVDQPGIDAERDVVQEQAPVDGTDVDRSLAAVAERAQRREGIFAVQPDVPGEMVTGPERDDHEGQLALHRGGGDRRE